ncbi:transposase [Crenobacter sp. SG2305]|uniref:IS66-like element accessory protein TnpA n=1 Tax=Crenobacter oryzisoli TaxID=3056844 RepID=UPI0025AAAAF7|nr:transposase [Crenobacter sp. SG2305]MDN0085636.1 transposase [Crenobacter sp. SG2305]
MDTLHLPEAGRHRRRYSAAFKAEIVAACLQPGVSTTAIALANRINPNLVRRWIRLQQPAGAEPAKHDVAGADHVPPQSVHSAPALVPVRVADPADDSNTVRPGQLQALRPLRSTQRPPSIPPPAESICLELRRGDTLLNVAWPASQAEACVRWLRELWS